VAKLRSTISETVVLQIRNHLLLISVPKAKRQIVREGAHKKVINELPEKCPLQRSLEALF
jgi:hypothetical protein